MAKFFVGQRVKVIKASSHLLLGLEGVVSATGAKGGRRGRDIEVRLDSAPFEYENAGWLFFQNEIEPITDTWAQDKVSQLVKQCMPVAA